MNRSTDIPIKSRDPPDPAGFLPSFSLPVFNFNICYALHKPMNKWMNVMLKRDVTSVLPLQKWKRVVCLSVRLLPSNTNPHPRSGCFDCLNETDRIERKTVRNLSISMHTECFRHKHVHRHTDPNPYPPTRTKGHLVDLSRMTGELMQEGEAGEIPNTEGALFCAWCQECAGRA